METLTTATLTIEGMSCEHCVRAIQRALGGIPGVAKSEVKLGSAEVRYAAPATEGAVREAIAAEGFVVTAATGV